MVNLEKTIEQLKPVSGGENSPVSLKVSEKTTVAIYPKSIRRLENDLLFMGRSGNEKRLFLLSSSASKFVSTPMSGETVIDGDSLKSYPLNHSNAVVMRHHFESLRPVLLGSSSSLGFGDRLGIATPGHIRSIQGKPLRAILAQQSVRELDRTERKPDDVMDCALWGAFQEGFHDGFGADADHLKSTEHIDWLMDAGFTFYTFDPGAFVLNEASAFSMETLNAKLPSLPWDVLNDTPDAFLSRYEGKTFRFSNDVEIQPDSLAVRRAIIKYGEVIAHTVKLYRHLKDKHHGKPSEVELSVDETDSPTTPFEHFLISNELKRLGVQIVSLAPRFIGDFEKGIDYKGDLNAFKKEYAQHASIAQALGPYKISIHSGSDKFDVYKAIGDLNIGSFHVKTAGTSYLEALRTVAKEEPVLFAEILDFCRSHYEMDKKSYHVSANIEKVLPSKFYTKENLLRLLDDVHARQVLHVTFGSVLTTKDAFGKPLFKDRLMRTLDKYESSHYELLSRHLSRHIEPFLKSLQTR